VHLKAVLEKKNYYIRELEIKLRDMKQDNLSLKERAAQLESDNQDLQTGNFQTKKVS
jgi:hypothetical protein